MTTPQQAYQELTEISKETRLIDSIGSLLNWELETYMPKNGAELRAQQLSYLSGLAHRKFTDPKIGKLLDIADSNGVAVASHSDKAINLREWRHSYDREIKVPTELVEEIARTAVVAHDAWVQAREKSDFSIFLPDLGKLVALVRQKAEYIGYKDTPYDALLDGFEPGVTTAQVKVWFDNLKAELVPLLKAIQASPLRPKTEIVHRHYPIDRQKIFGQAAAAAFGFNFGGGRLDTVTHPFCSTLGPGDSRITTRYTDTFFNESFFGILHETGHGLYGQNLPADAFGTPLGDSISLGIHESQSRLWENFVGRSQPYWRYFFPRAQQIYPEALGDVSSEEFYFAVNEVKPSYIRVEADEVTYNLHIMLRFEIEQAIITGELAVEDIPAVWNEMFEDFLGIPVPDDSRGCLQDVHWSFAGFGYFSTYALGNLYGAQIFAKIREDMPDLDQQMACGDFMPLLDWLRVHIYSMGQRYRSMELVEQITGRHPGHEALTAYLNQKFGELYQL